MFVINILALLSRNRTFSLSVVSFIVIESPISALNFFIVIVIATQPTSRSINRIQRVCSCLEPRPKSFRAICRAVYRSTWPSGSDKSAEGHGQKNCAWKWMPEIKTHLPAYEACEAADGEFVLKQARQGKYFSCTAQTLLAPVLLTLCWPHLRSPPGKRSFDGDNDLHVVQVFSRKLNVPRTLILWISIYALVLAHDSDNRI